MNKDLKLFLEENDIKLRKLTIKGNVKIIDADNSKYVIKKKNKEIKKIYKYLSSRSFENYPKIILDNPNYDIYEFIDDVEEPFEQKVLDIIKLVSILHSKTTFYKNIDSDEYKYLYENIINKIDYLYNYYNDLVSIYEKEEFMSPSSYIMSRNISKIFEMLNYCKIHINKWYDIINEKKRVRIVQLHNNLSVDHYLKNKYPYLISWSKSKRDMPIYDLLKVFNLYYYELDFCDLLHTYEMNYPLLEEEKNLLFVLISMPEKITLEGNEYSKCLQAKKFYDKLVSAENSISDYMPKEKRVP